MKERKNQRYNYQLFFDDLEKLTKSLFFGKFFVDLVLIKVFSIMNIV